MTDITGESNPFSLTVPDSIRGVSQDLYDFLRSMAQTQRDQHNKTQAGDTTFPWQILQTIDDKQTYNLGSLGSFYHETFGVVQGRYVRFANMLDTAPGRPVTLLRGDSFAWTVTNDVTQGSDGAVQGLGVGPTWPKGGQYGWIQVAGANLFALNVESTEKLPIGSSLGWAADGTIQLGSALTHDFGTTAATGDGTGLYGVGSIQINTLTADISGLKRQLAVLQTDDSVAELTDQYVDLRKTLTLGLDKLEAQYKFSRVVVVNANEASITQTETLNAMANFANKADFAAYNASHNSDLTFANLYATNEALKQARVYRDETGFYADSVTTNLNLATVQTNLATYQAVVATGAAAQASDSAAQAEQYSKVAVSNSTNLIPNFDEWTIYPGTNCYSEPGYGLRIDSLGSEVNTTIAMADSPRYNSYPGTTYTASADLASLNVYPNDSCQLQIIEIRPDGSVVSAPSSEVQNKQFSNDGSTRTQITYTTSAESGNDWFVRVFWARGAEASASQATYFAARRPKMELGSTMTGYTDETSLVRVKASVDSESVARINADNAEAYARQQLGASLSNGITNVNGRVTDEVSARVSAVDAVSTRVEQVNAYFASPGANQCPDVQYWDCYNNTGYEPNDANWGPLLNTGVPPQGEQVYGQIRLTCYANQTYTFSADLRSFMSNQGYIWIDMIFVNAAGNLTGSPRAGQNADFDFSNSRRFSCTARTPSDTVAVYLRYCGNWNGSGYGINSMRRPKFELGGSPTPYSTEGTTKFAFAAVNTEIQARANAISAVSSRIDSVTAQLGGVQAQVTQNLSAVVDNNGNAVGKWYLSAQGSDGRRTLTLSSDSGLILSGNMLIDGNLVVTGTINGKSLNIGSLVQYGTIGSSQTATNGLNQYVQVDSFTQNLPIQTTYNPTRVEVQFTGGGITFYTGSSGLYDAGDSYAFLRVNYPNGQYMDTTIAGSSLQSKVPVTTSLIGKFWRLAIPQGVGDGNMRLELWLYQGNTDRTDTDPGSPSQHYYSPKVTASGLLGEVAWRVI
jgi:hypothetical protein